jgi:hypothetical protein
MEPLCIYACISPKIFTGVKNKNKDTTVPIDTSFLHSILTSTGVHSVSCLMCIEGVLSPNVN